MGKKRVIQKGIDEEKKSAGGSVAPSILKESKKKSAVTFESGNIYIQSSYNNTKITVTDEKGDVIAWSTAGSLGYAGPKKSTPFAASKVTETIVEKISKTGPHIVNVYVSGVGPGRDSAVRSLAGGGFDIRSIHDVTPIAHNGPRPRKRRRT
jgi:small subunit ribosomal protein S11